MAAAMPMNTPYAKNPVVTCCSQSHGCPIVRVTTSENTETVNPIRHVPQSTISAASTGSSAAHFRCRWRRRTSGAWATRALLHLADHVEELHRVGTELLRELVLDRLGGLHEA